MVILELAQCFLQGIDFLLKRLNVTFFNLSHDNFTLNSEMAKLSKRHTLQLMLNMHRSQPGRLSVHTQTKSAKLFQEGLHEANLCDVQ